MFKHLVEIAWNSVMGPNKPPEGSARPSDASLTSREVMQDIKQEALRIAGETDKRGKDSDGKGMDRYGFMEEDEESDEMEGSMVSTLFIWRHGGNNVFLTGSFNKWLGKIPMQQVKERPMEFELKIDIPPGKHHFKFIVDDRWKFAPELPSEMDKDGKVTNVIEIVSLQPIPGPEEFTTPPPPIPPHFMTNILTPADNKSRLQTLKPQDRVPDIESIVLPTPDHVTINHLFQAKRNISLNSTLTDYEADQPLVMGITQRYRNKFVTTVYYKPKPSIDSY